MFYSLLFALLLGGSGEAVLFNDTAGLFEDWGTEAAEEKLAVSGGLEDSPPFTSLKTSASDYDPFGVCLLYTSPSPRDRQKSRMPSSA